MKKLVAGLCLTAISLVGFGQQKNILFIAVDDLKPLINAYGESQMHTPNLDRLASMGAIFTNAHVQQAVCGPSRASIMTAMYPDRTKVWDLQTDFRKSSPSLISMPEYLISQGYQTHGIGKIYHKPSAAPGHDGKSWSIPYETELTFDPKYGEPAMSFYQKPETKEKIEELLNEATQKKVKNKRDYVLDVIKPSTESADVPDNAYVDGAYTEKAIERLREMNAGNNPFFLAVGFQRPHLPFNAPTKYWDLYDRKDIKTAEFQQLTKGTPPFAFHSFGELRSYSDIDDNLDIGIPIEEEKQKELIHGYMAAVSYIDAQIGKLLDELDNLGILEETVIVLWGDHGFHLGDHTEWCKHSNFEQATRIPLIFAGSGIAGGQVIDHPVELLDVFPTLFDLSKVNAVPGIDGISLLPLMDNDSKTSISKDYAISQYPRNGKKIMGYSIRTERYRYTEWHDNRYTTSSPYNEENIIGIELYDYQEDPLETENFFENPKYKKARKQLRKKLRKHLNSLHETAL